MNRKHRIFYEYYPFAVFLFCLGAEFIESPSPFKGRLLFVVWPLLLLLWLVYWGRKEPQVRQRTYYLLMWLIFIAFAIAIVMPAAFVMLNIPEEYRQKVRSHLGYVMAAVYMILAIYQLWVIRKNRNKQYRNEVRSSNHVKE